MHVNELAIDRLHPHPQNSNVMPEALLAKLANHVEQTDRYPPVIVRPLPVEESSVSDSAGHYQILDGHHRVEALRRIGRVSARCVVWDVDDAEALLLLAMLNRLQGQDDPRKRAALVGRLHEHLDVKTLVAKLPEDGDRLRKLMRLNDGLPTPRPPQPIGEMPVAVHFFLLPHQRTAVERRLREAMGKSGDSIDGAETSANTQKHSGDGMSREDALLQLLGVNPER
ncbi:MAG: ParB/RepB/Spo0J family partition protein [Planctomycetota bacterium]